MYNKIINIFLFFLSLILVYLSFPNNFSNLSFLNFLCSFVLFVPFFLFLLRKKNLNIKFKKVFIRILLFSIFANFVLVYWIIPTFMKAGIVFFLSFLSAFLLAFYLAIYYIIFFVIFYLCLEKYKYKFNFRLVIFMSSIWVVLEFVRTYMFSGFPWNLLGLTNFKNLYFIQIADICGIYGVSFFIIFINLYIFYILDFFTGNILDTKKNDFKKNIFILLIFILLIYSYGFLSKFKFDRKDSTYKKNIDIAILQGNIDQYKKFDNVYYNYIRDNYLNLIKKNLDIDLFIFPETSDPIIFNSDKELLFNSKNYLKENFFDNHKMNARNNFLMGVFEKNNKNFYNSAIFFDNNYNLIDIYRKNHLVPFGEYFPFKKIIENIIPSIKNFGNVNFGKNISIFYIKDIGFCTNICFESIFPNLIRKYYNNKDKQNIKFLVNISNDGWYLNTSAPFQHFAANIFRAIENRKFVFRAANTGISGVINSFGRIKKMTKIYELDRIDFKFFYDDSNIVSFYSKFGDKFILFCFLFMILFFYKYKIKINK